MAKKTQLISGDRAPGNPPAQKIVMTGKDIRGGDPGRAMGSGTKAQSGFSRARAASGLSGDGAGGRGEDTFGSGPKIFEGTRPTPDRIDYDGARGVPADHPTAQNAASNMLAARRAQMEPRDTESSAGCGIEFPNFTDGK